MITRIQETTLSLLASHTHPHVILGLSGGADSVFLFYVLAPLHHEKKITLSALHINHGWRESAQRDELFCKELCRDHNIPFFSEHTTQWRNTVPPHKQNSGSLEADAREIRRLIFNTYQKKLNAHVIALAHHANDQIETFFIRMIRGSGLSGLCSMQENTNHTIRPLLGIEKEALLSWLTTHHKPFCHDETNESLAFLRNRIRSLLMPALTACDSRATSSFLRTIKNLQQEDEVLNTLCAETITKISAHNGWYITKQFLACLPALRVRIMTQLCIMHHLPLQPSERLFREIERFLSSPRGGVHALTTEWRIIKKSTLFSFKKPKS